MTHPRLTASLLPPPPARYLSIYLSLPSLCPDSTTIFGISMRKRLGEIGWVPLWGDNDASGQAPSWPDIINMKPPFSSASSSSSSSSFLEVLSHSGTVSVQATPGDQRLPLKRSLCTPPAVTGYLLQASQCLCVCVRACA